MTDLTPTPDERAARDLADAVTRSMEAGSPMRKTQAVIDRTDTLSRQNDLLSGVVANLMHRLNITTLIMGSFELEHGPRVSIKPDAVTKDSADKHYYIELRQGRCGS